MFYTVDAGPLQPIWTVASGYLIGNAYSVSPDCQFSITVKTLIVALLTILTACESDASKLSRLRGDRATYCILAEADKRQLAMIRNQQPSKQEDSLLSLWDEHSTKCQLAERELNRFMR